MYSHALAERTTDNPITSDRRMNAPSALEFLKRNSDCIAKPQLGRQRGALSNERTWYGFQQQQQMFYQVWQKDDGKISFNGFINTLPIGSVECQDWCILKLSEQQLPELPILDG